MLSNLFPYLILAGLTILAVLFWLLRQARRMTRLHLELVRRNEELRFDLPDFLEQSWPLLRRAGFSGLGWRLEWFGTVVSRIEGEQAGEVLRRVLTGGENRLEVWLHHPKLRGERRYFSQSLAENFFLLLQVDLGNKAGAVQGAFAQAARLGMFLQHDMKNIAQFIQLAADQVEGVQPGNEARLVASLRAGAPAMRGRAERILHAMAGQGAMGLGGHAQVQSSRHYDLAEEWRAAGRIHGLTVAVAGEAVVSLPAGVLEGIMDNLIGNYGDQARSNPEPQPEVRINLEQRPDAVVVTLSDHHGQPCSKPERLFEPFWSSRGGLGIGLYQARQLANSVGGRLEVAASAGQPLVFVLTLPG